MSGIFCWVNQITSVGSNFECNIELYFQKDVMFRQGGVGTTSLYSPAGTSDSSGFSEQRDQSFSPAPGGQPTAQSGYLQQHNITNESVRLGPTGALFSLQCLPSQQLVPLLLLYKCSAHRSKSSQTITKSSP